MESKEFRRIYHPSLGRFVYEHRGSGFIIENIFKPTKEEGESFLKLFVKKALKSGIESAGDKLGKKVVETVAKKVAPKPGKKVAPKSGNFLIKDLQKEFNSQKQEEDYNVLLNRMISGEGFKKQKKQKIKKF